MAATAHCIQVSSTPTALAARPTQSGLPAIEVRNIMQVTASAWKPTCIRYLPMRPAVGSGSESKALESDWTIG